jgi:hypothetical protein
VYHDPNIQIVQHEKVVYARTTCLPSDDLDGWMRAGDVIDVGNVEGPVGDKRPLEATVDLVLE